jgi:hypothetical protein
MHPVSDGNTRRVINPAAASKTKLCSAESRYQFTTKPAS